MIFCIQEGLLIERFDDQTLVFQVDNNLPYILNGVAAFILRNTDGKKNKEEIAEKICMKFDVGYSTRPWKILKAFMRNLSKRDL